MIVKECMSKNVTLGRPDMTLFEAAKKMRDGHFGILPIEENDKLVGMITDRDITIRSVAEGKNPQEAKVRDIMSDQVLYCYDDQSIETVAQNLGDNQIWRLPVVNRQKRLVGILSMADLAKAKVDPSQLENSLSQMAKPQDHSQHGRLH